MSSNDEEENQPIFIEDEESIGAEEEDDGDIEIVENEHTDEVYDGEGEEEEEEVEVEEVGVDVEEGVPEPVQPRRSNRQPKRKKRSSSDSGNEEPEETKSKVSCPLSHMREYIKIGNEYQANVDDASKHDDDDEERDELIWKRPQGMKRKPLANYIAECAGRFRMPIDRALYILERSGYDFGEAMNQVARRKQLRDIWSVDENLLFTNAYMVYGKDFLRIRRSALPHRSYASIIQHYYDTKKHTPYKSSADIKISDIEESDDEEDEAIDGLFSGTCENCGERTAMLEYSKATDRKECKTCLIYLKLNRTPRPSNIRAVTAELRKTNVDCPKKMKPLLVRYKELSQPGTGDPLNRLKIKIENMPDDDDVMIIDQCDLTKPAPPLDNDNNIDDDPVDINTCRLTRDFESQEARKMIRRMDIRGNLAIPCVWRRSQTICMEDIEILNEESRKMVFKSSQMFGRVNKVEVGAWKIEMAQARFRMDRKSEDSDLAPSATGKRKNTSYSWQDQERKDAIQCFYWYGDDFDTIAEIIPTKTADQLKSFYADLGEELINDIHEKRDSMQQRAEQETTNLHNQLRSIRKTENIEDDTFDIMKILNLS